MQKVEKRIDPTLVHTVRDIRGSCLLQASVNGDIRTDTRSQWRTEILMQSRM